MALKRPFNGILRTGSGGRISLMVSIGIIMKRCMGIDKKKDVEVSFSICESSANTLPLSLVIVLNT